jgi:hypothetical protein
MQILLSLPVAEQDLNIIYSEMDSELHFSLLQLPSLLTYLHRAQLSTANSESELFYAWRFTTNQFTLAPSPLRLTAINFFSTDPLLS